ncbi:hypothetical protein TNCV_3023911 [Trichonephila clavipes]|nr:hypothetical protein TNCV_3023911 [Trichonephila clavipes]
MKPRSHKYGENHIIKECYIKEKYGNSLETQWLSGRVSLFHATGPGFKLRAGQGHPFSESKMSNKRAWELNTGGFRIRLTTCPEQLLMLLSVQGRKN